MRRSRGQLRTDSARRRPPAGRRSLSALAGEHRPTLRPNRRASQDRPPAPFRQDRLGTTRATTHVNSRQRRQRHFNFNRLVERRSNDSALRTAVTQPTVRRELGVWGGLVQNSGLSAGGGGVGRLAKSNLQLEDLDHMLRAIPSTTHAGRRDRALLLLGLAGALRRSELVAIDCAHIRHEAEGVILTIPRSKGDQLGAGEETQSRSATVPTSVLFALSRPGRVLRASGPERSPCGCGRATSSPRAAI